MIASIQIKAKQVTIDLSKPIDISMTLSSSKNNVNAWYVGEPKIEPVQMDNWIGSVEEGADVNFNSIQFNPHAHGTHTECVGHITKQFYSINQCLKQFVFTAELITVTPKKQGNDFVITKKSIETLLKNKTPEALVIRTTPNNLDKTNKQYSNTNWAYLTEAAAQFIASKHIKHLLIDLPSVDKEKDEGKLLAHKAFWFVGKKIRINATITEFIYVPNKVKDGSFILNLQIASFENDASPSKPILYTIL